MTTGISTANLANKWLDMIGGTAFTAPAASYVGVHTADPGALGTTSPCTGAVGGVRKAVVWGAAAAGSKAMTGTPSWASWDGGSVTISHVSAWDALSSGNFLFSGALAAGQAITNGATFNLTSLSIALTPVAA
jgi:hypothetical protein